MKQFKLTVYWLIAILLWIVSFFSLLVFTVFLGNKDVNTITLTNIGFAVLISLSAALFNWAKSIDIADTTNKRIIKSLNAGAITCIVNALFFIFGSLFKYIAINYKSLIEIPLFSPYVDQQILIFSNMLCLTISNIMTFSVIIKVTFEYLEYYRISSR